MTLTAEQQAVVDIDSGRHLVLAPPGTGKTQMLTERVKRALANGVAAEEMLCGTFTIRAAAEMEARIRAETGLDDKALPLVGNLHHICHRFLFGNHLVPQSRQVVDGNFRDETLQGLKQRHPAPEFFLLRHYLKQAWGGEEIDYYRYNADFSKAIDIALALKNGTPTEFLDIRPNPCIGTVFVEEVCCEYMELKENLFVLDFDDLLSETYRVLSSGNLPAGFKKYKWLQIDEVQDLNPLQWAIVDALAAPDAVFVFFGDYEQSIYSFMGASSKLLDQKAEPCELHFFETNFRATSYLLDLLSRYSFRILGSSFPFLPFPTRYESGEGHMRIMTNSGMPEVVAEAARMLDDGRTDNAAILVQTNQQADEAEQCARQRGVSYVKVSGFEFNSRKIYRDLAALMDVVGNPLARVAWSRIIRHFARRIVRTQSDAQAMVSEMFRLCIDPRDLIDDELVQMRALTFERYGERARNGRVVVFDTETTGLKPQTDHIVQLTGVEYVKGVPGRRLNLFLKSPIPMPPEVEAIHHISDAKLAAEGMEPAEGIRLFLEFLGQDLLIAHNLRFDKRMLVNACRRYDIPFNPDAIPMCDTLTLCRQLHPELTVYKLGVLLEEFGLEGNNSHDALDDVLAAGNLFFKLVEDGLEKVEGQRRWFADHEEFVSLFAKNAVEYFAGQKTRMEGAFDLKREALAFVEYSMENKLYTQSDCKKMIKELRVGEADEESPANELLEGEQFSAAALLAPLDKLFDYLDSRYSGDSRSFRQVIYEDWDEISKLKEADLIPDDANLVISTMHKAKGRQFDTVFIPYCQDSYSDRMTGKKVNGFPSFQVKFFGGDRAENARLLYVGMSRAKRNLVLASDRFAVSPYLEPCLECFGRGHKDFYFRMYENGGKLYDFREDDWMARLYFLILCKKEHRDPPQFIKWFDDTVDCIRRIAYGLLPKCSDDKLFANVVKTALSRPGIDRAAAVDCIKKRKDVHFVKDLRSLMLKMPVGHSLKADIIAALDACSADPVAIEGLEDAVFEAFGPHRVDAANRLAAHGILKYQAAVKGNDEDWQRLAPLIDVRARKVLEWRVSHALPGSEIHRQLLEI